MHRYHDAHYTTGNITVVACGSVDHAAIVDLAARYLSGLPVGPWLERGPVDTRERVMLSCVKKDSEQANIVLGAPTIVNDDPRRFAYSLLDIIIGGGMSSRLFQEIREKRGSSSHSVYRIIAARRRSRHLRDVRGHASGEHRRGRQGSNGAIRAWQPKTA